LGEHLHPQAACCRRCSIWLANPVSWHKHHPGIALDEFTVHPSLTAGRLNFWQAMGGTDGVMRWVGTSFSNIFKVKVNLCSSCKALLAQVLPLLPLSSLTIKCTLNFSALELR
jgi:hypothetical protein